MDTPNWVTSLGLFMAYPILIVATAILVLFFSGLAWFVRAHIGKERIATLNERLQLASDRHTLVTEQIEVMGPEIARLKVELAEAKASPNSPRFEALTVTTSAVSDRMDVIALANNSLGKTLTPSGAAAAHTWPTWVRLPQPDQLLYARLLTSGWILNFNPSLNSPRT